MTRLVRSAGTAAVLVLLGTLASRCTSSRPAPAASVPPLLGVLQPVVSVKELMAGQIDPLADNIFNAVSVSVTTTGTTRVAPASDDDWAKIQSGAVTLAEAANLLKIPRPFAPAGDLNDSGGPDAPELSPEAIRKKVEADLPRWDSHVEALRAIAVEVLGIVKRKDVSALDAAAGRLDKACESCHLEYWYPGDRKIIAGILARDREKAEAEEKAKR